MNPLGMFFLFATRIKYKELIDEGIDERIAAMEALKDTKDTFYKAGLIK